MRILITGGTGTISRFLTPMLTAQGHDVTLLHYRSLAGDELAGARSAIADRNDSRAFVQAAGALGDFDCVYDMLCYSPENARSAVEAFSGRTGQLVMCSSVDVYAKQPALYPITEDAPRCPDPAFAGGSNKLACEDILMEEAARGGFDLTVMRPAHTYAEGVMRSHLLFTVFGGDRGACWQLDRLRRGKPIILPGDGLSVWTETHGRDVAAAFAAACTSKAARGRAYNVCSDRAMTTEQLWRTVARAMGAPEPEFVRIPSEFLMAVEPERAAGNYNNFRFNNIFDNSAAVRDLGFAQTISFEEGARRCIAAFDQWEDCRLPQYAFYDRLIAIWREAAAGAAAQYAKYRKEQKK